MRVYAICVSLYVYVYGEEGGGRLGMATREIVSTMAQPPEIYAAAAAASRAAAAAVASLRLRRGRGDRLQIAAAHAVFKGEREEKLASRPSTAPRPESPSIAKEVCVREGV
jgi:hypothetical protein